MAIKHENFISIRFDVVTKNILQGLVSDLNFNQSEIIRRAIRLLNELNEIKKQRGEILVRTDKGEIVVLIS